MLAFWVQENPIPSQVHTITVQNHTISSIQSCVILTQILRPEKSGMKLLWGSRLESLHKALQKVKHWILFCCKRAGCPRPGTLGKPEIEAHSGDSRATIRQGHEFQDGTIKKCWYLLKRHSLSVRWVRCVSWPFPRRIETHSTPRSIWRPLCSCKRISPERRSNWKKYLKLLAELDLPIWSQTWRKHLKLLAKLDLPISRMNFMVVVKHQLCPPDHPESQNPIFFVVIMPLICFDHLKLLLWELLGFFSPSWNNFFKTYGFAAGPTPFWFDHCHYW